MMRQVKNLVQVRLPRVYKTLSRLLRTSMIRYQYRHRPESLDWHAGYTGGERVDDTEIIDRVVRSYLARAETPSGQWAEIYSERHGDIHDALVGGHRSRIEEILRDPNSSDLMYGFDNMAKSLLRGGKRIEEAHAPALTLDALISVAEAVGARPVANPERYRRRVERTGVAEIIEQIEHATGIDLQFPNFFPQEYGLESPKGIISYRAAQAIWQAWRISQLVRGLASPKVLEIGGGLGRTAYYARLFGIHDYTIVDIPISSLAQGYFLGCALGPEAVCLHGEPVPDSSRGRIRLMTPAYFLPGSQRYDLVVNVDSLTEIGKVAADEYLTAIGEHADRFLSVNHEENEITVSGLMKAGHGSLPASRSPCWTRRGYVDEVFQFVGAPRHT
jgi:hypothetical protein